MTEIQGNLKLLIKTWSRDSHGLFDYETSSTKTNQLLISNSCKLIRKKNDVRFVQENHEIEFEERELAKIFFEENKIRISNPLNFGMIPTENNINDLQNKIWHVIKHDDNSQESQSSILSAGMYEIKLNEIIKLGRVKYAVTEVKIDDNLQTIENHIKKPVFQLISEHKKIEENPSQEILCKICYSNSDDESNPMINLCKCTGSISSIHFSCLKKWMNTKLSTKENEKKTVISYSMKSFNCEICMAPYPLKFRFENKEFNIIDLVRPESKNYIILESLNQLKEKNNYKSIQVINLKENERILMGRGHDTDVRINDISVSRSHADLILIDNKIYIKDLRSKFGTLVLAQKDIELRNKQANLQIGRSYIEFLFSKENQKGKKESNGTKFYLNSSLTGSSLEDKFLAPLSKSEEIKSNKSENIHINSPLFDMECDKITQINSTNENENCTSNQRKTSAFGNLRSQTANINIFSVTNNNSKASSTTNLDLNEDLNAKNKSKLSSILNAENNSFKTPSNERVNSESSINYTNLKFNLIKNDSLDSFRNGSLFTKQNHSSFDDNKNIIQNPLIETVAKNTSSLIQINEVNKNNQNKYLNNDAFGIGIIEIPNQSKFVNTNSNLFSLNVNSIPNELLNELQKNSSNIYMEKNNTNTNPLLSSIPKNFHTNLDNQTNFNYLNNFFNNEQTRLINSGRNENQNINQIPNQFNYNSNQINTNYCPRYNEEYLKANNFANLGYFDMANYEMKLNLLNSLSNFSNLNNFNNQNKDNVPINNHSAQTFLFSNLSDRNFKSNYLNNQSVNMTNNFNSHNVNSIETNNTNNFFFNNLYNQKNSQTNININENQSFKTNSNDIENS